MTNPSAEHPAAVAARGRFLEIAVRLLRQRGYHVYSMDAHRSGGRRYRSGPLPPPTSQAGSCAGGRQPDPRWESVTGRRGHNRTADNARAEDRAGSAEFKAFTWLRPTTHPPEVITLQLPVARPDPRGAPSAIRRFIHRLYVEDWVTTLSTLRAVARRTSPPACWSTRVWPD